MALNSDDWLLEADRAPHLVWSRRESQISIEIQASRDPGQSPRVTSPER
jgi:hypothetical protein